MENLLLVSLACLWQDGQSRVNPYLIHPDPPQEDYWYAIIAFSLFVFYVSSPV